MRELEHIGLFIEVATRRSFSETARHLNQPNTTISRKIQQLESELNIKLFHRTTRAVSLTEIGEKLLPKAKQLMDISNEMVREVETHTETPSGRLHISSSSIVLQQLIPFLAEFTSQNPDVTLNLESSGRYLDLVELGIDFAFRLGPLCDSSLISMHIASVPYALVGEKNFVRSRPALNHPKQLNDWPCTRIHIDGLLLPWHFEKNKESYNFESDNFLLSNDMRVCAQMALNGSALAMLPICIAKRHFSNGTLVRLLDDWLPKPRELYLVYTNREHLPSKSKAFIEFVRNNRERLDATMNTWPENS